MAIKHKKELEGQNARHLYFNKAPSFEGMALKFRRVPHSFWFSGIVVFLVIAVFFLPDVMWRAFWASLKDHIALSVMLFLFTIISVSLLWSKGQRLDSWVFCFVNAKGKRPRGLDLFMLSFTQLGNGVFTFFLSLIFFLRHNRLFAYELMVSTLALWFVVELIKVMINRSRPFLTLRGVRVVGQKERGYSFPSGHTSQAFYLATLMVQYFQPGLTVSLFLYFLAFLVGITRIYVGAHYPRDVLAGAILGSFWGIIGVLANRYIF